MKNRRHTFCRICEPTCPLIAEMNDQGEITSLHPDHDHPVGGTPCHKGLTFLDVHNDPDRLNWPLRRTNPKSDGETKFERVEWESSIADIGSKLAALREEYGPNAVAAYFGNPTAFNATLIASIEPLLAALGTRMMFSSTTQDCASKFSGAWAIYGSKDSQTIPDIYNTHYLLCVGANPRISKWTLISTPSDPDVVKGIKRRGGKVVFVNPRHIESSTGETGETLQIIPGTDVYFLAAVLNEISRSQGLHGPLVDRYGKNLNGLRAFVERYPAERVAAVVGIGVEAIRQVAKDLIVAKSAAVYVSLGVNQGRQGLLCYWLAEMLNFVTGNLGRRGGTLKPSGLAESYAIDHASAVDTSIGSISVFDPPSLTLTPPSTMLPDLIDAGDIKALIVICGNPLLTTGGEVQVRGAFEKLELLVTLDIFQNATGELADYILPTTDWLEREDINLFGSGMQTFPNVQYSEALLKPAGERRTEAWIIARLLEAMGVPSPGGSFGDSSLGTSILDSLLEARGLSVEQMRQQPHQTVRFDDLPAESFFQRCLWHPDRKVDCFPGSFLEMGLMERCEQIFADLAADDPASLKLIMLRTPICTTAGLPIWTSSGAAKTRLTCFTYARRMPQPVVCTTATSCASAMTMVKS